MTAAEDMRRRRQRGNTILFSKDGEYLIPLSDYLNTMDRRAVVIWALGLADDAAKELSTRKPQEERPARAIEAAWLWAGGREKMSLARRFILDCHAAAHDMIDPADAALCHAIGQACSVVHTTKHALGFPLYDLTATALSAGDCDIDKLLDAKLSLYFDRAVAAVRALTSFQGDWAPFMNK